MLKGGKAIERLGNFFVLQQYSYTFDLSYIIMPFCKKIGQLGMSDTYHLCMYIA